MGAQTLSIPVLPPAFAEAMVERFSNSFTTNRVICEQHGKDPGHHALAAPQAVLFAENTQSVADAVRLCALHAVPIIPFGVGSSLEGHITAPHGGLSLDLSKMNRVLAVHADDQDCRVEAGVTRDQLNDYLRADGLHFPIDPGAHASLGGMAATRASGTNAVRYGTMRDNVLGLTIVTPQGDIVHTGSRARKSSAGYDLTGLYVGSEGTLGVITEVHLRLYGRPEAVTAAVCTFPTVEDAVNTVIATIQLGVPVARVELLDALSIKAVNLHSDLGLPETPHLFFEFHGSEAHAKEQSDLVRELAADSGGSDFRWAHRQEERNALWRARHEAFWAAKELRPGADVWSTDVCVPISRLAEAIVWAQNDLKLESLTAPILGHVGDGNFHVFLVIDQSDKLERSRAIAFNDRLVAKALEFGGTCTGEHGIGVGKMKHLAAEQPTSLPLMRHIKMALDPNNLMNPGKIFNLH